MAQASVPPGSVPLPTEEFNDEPVTPTSARWTDDHAPLRTASPESLLPSPPPKWKGKQREIIPVHYDQHVSSDVREVDLGRASPEQEIHEAPTESLVSATYPPAAEEAVEERKVNETLKRWEQLERQRRKAARERLSNDSTASANQSSAARSDITRRGSLFWTGARSRKPGPDSHPLPTGDVEGDRSPSAEDFSLPPESEEVAVVRVRSQDDFANARESFIARHRPSSSLESHVSDSSAATVTPADLEHKPTDHASNVSTIFTPKSDPFADPATTSRKENQTPRIKSRTSDPFADGRASGDDTSYIPAHPPTAGSLGLKRPPRYPTPKPLGLPLTAIRDPAQSPTNDPNRRQRRPDGDDDDDSPAEVGRWWTDWLCGCREGPDRGGDHQAAKTNPFE